MEKNKEQIVQNQEEKLIISKDLQDLKNSYAFLKSEQFKNAPELEQPIRQDQNQQIQPAPKKYTVDPVQKAKFKEFSNKLDSLSIQFIKDSEFEKTELKHKMFLIYKDSLPDEYSLNNERGKYTQYDEVWRKQLSDKALQDEAMYNGVMKQVYVNTEKEAAGDPNYNDTGIGSDKIELIRQIDQYLVQCADKNKIEAVFSLTARPVHERLYIYYLIERGRYNGPDETDLKLSQAGYTPSLKFFKMKFEYSGWNIFKFGSFHWNRLDRAISSTDLMKEELSKMYSEKKADPPVKEPEGMRENDEDENLIAPKEHEKTTEFKKLEDQFLMFTRDYDFKLSRCENDAEKHKLEAEKALFMKNFKASFIDTFKSFMDDSSQFTQAYLGVSLGKFIADTNKKQPKKDSLGKKINDKAVDVSSFALDNINKNVKFGLDTYKNAITVKDYWDAEKGFKFQGGMSMFENILSTSTSVMGAFLLINNMVNYEKKTKGLTKTEKELAYMKLVNGTISTIGSAFGVVEKWMKVAGVAKDVTDQFGVGSDFFGMVGSTEKFIFDIMEFKNATKKRCKLTTAKKHFAEYNKVSIADHLDVKEKDDWIVFDEKPTYKEAKKVEKHKKGMIKTILSKLKHEQAKTLTNAVNDGLKSAGTALKYSGVAAGIGAVVSLSTIVYQIGTKIGFSMAESIIKDNAREELLNYDKTRKEVINKYVARQMRINTFHIADPKKREEQIRASIDGDLGYSIQRRILGKLGFFTKRAFYDHIIAIYANAIRKGLNSEDEQEALGYQAVVAALGIEYDPNELPSLSLLKKRLSL